MNWHEWWNWYRVAVDFLDNGYEHIHGCEVCDRRFKRAIYILNSLQEVKYVNM